MSDLIRCLQGQRIDGRSTDELMRAGADEIKRLRATIEEQRLSIAALNLAIGGPGSLTTENLALATSRATEQELRELIGRISAWSEHQGLTPHQRWEQISRELACASVQPSAVREEVCSACNGSGEDGYEYSFAVGPSPCRECGGRGTTDKPAAAP